MATLLLEKNAETHAEYFDNELWISCSWLAASTYHLDYINFQIGGDGSPTGTITLQIFAADGSFHPTGAVLATGTYNAADVDLAHGYPYIRQKFDLGTGCSIVSGNTYCMQLKGSVHWDFPNRPTLWVTTSGTAGYTQAYSTNSGASWTNIAGHAFGFQMYGYIPDPVTKILELAFNQSIFTDRDVLTWTDVTSYLRALNIKRGRQHELDRIEAGTATFTLDNTAGAWWRNNTTSPFYGTYGDVKPLTPIRLSVIYNGITYRKFYGVTEGFPHRFRTPMGYGAEVELRCVDIFKMLARYPLESNFIEQNSVNRFTGILNLSTLNFPAGMRYADSGTVDVIAYNPTTPAEREMALPHLLRVAEAEGGIIFVSGNGNINFQDGEARQKSPYNASVATFDGDGAISKFADIEFIDDDTFIYNQAMISGTGITEQIVRDPDAQATQGVRAYEQGDSLLANDADAFDKGFMIVHRYNDSEVRPESLVIKPEASPADLYPKVLGYDISTRITVQLDNTLNPAGIDQDYHIEGIEDDWEVDGQWITTWQLWRVNQFRSIKAEHDGHIVEALDDYDDAHDSAVGTAHNDETELAVGQISLDTGVEIFTIYRGFLQFDCTPILVTDTITAAYVLVHVHDTYAVDAAWNFTLVDPGGLVVPLVGADYHDLLDETDSYGAVTIPTASIDAGWWAIPLTAAGLANINKGGTTKFGIRSSKDISATPPGYLGAEYLRIDGMGSAYEPRLVVQLDL